MPARRPESSALASASPEKRASIASCRSSAMSALAPAGGGAAPERDQGQEQHQPERGQRGGERLRQGDGKAVDDGEGALGFGTGRFAGMQSNKTRTRLTRVRSRRYQSEARIADRVPEDSMSLLHIITLPDPKLRLVSKPIERVDDPLAS